VKVNTAGSAKCCQITELTELDDYMNVLQNTLAIIISVNAPDVSRLQSPSKLRAVLALLAVSACCNNLGSASAAMCAYLCCKSL